MFERFTAPSREVVIAAQLEARRLGHRQIGATHLLLALTRAPSPAADLLREFGVTTAVLEAELRRATPDDTGLSEADGEALSGMGIDLDAIRASVESRFGPGALDRELRPRRRGLPAWLSRRPPGSGHIPFTPGAKKTLELTLREAIRLHESRLEPDHILLGLLGAHDRATDSALAGLGLDSAQLRARLDARHRRSA